MSAPSPVIGIYVIYYLTKRCAQSVATIATVVIGVFFLARLTGDPTTLLLPQTASDETRALLSEKYGLDQSVWTQLRIYVQGLFHGDMGTSIWRAQPVFGIIKGQLPATLLLTGVVLAIAVPTAFVLGCAGGLRPEGKIAKVVSAMGAMAAAVADFWVALILIWIFAFQLKWLPSGGPPGAETLILPALTLCLYPVGVLSQVVRASVERARLQEYVRSASSRGLSTRRVAARYIIRNSLTPSLAVLGTLAISMINGVVIVETVFGWPGIGQLTIGAIRNRDFPLLQGIVLVVAVMTFIVNFVIDTTIAILDPRIRQSG